MSNDIDRESFEMLVKTVTRVESRLVRGFEELGIDLSVEEGWLQIDAVQKIVTLSTMGRSLVVIRQKMKAEGAIPNEWYTLVFKGEVVGKVLTL
jgi:hypothetical protein